MELSARLEHLTIEKSALENRNNILEKVLVMRDQELSNFKAEDSSAHHQACLLQPACIHYACSAPQHVSPGPACSSGMQTVQQVHTRSIPSASILLPSHWQLLPLCPFQITSLCAICNHITVCSALCQRLTPDNALECECLL